MSCGGSMMRTSMQPLAHLVDAAAERWLLAESAGGTEQQRVRDEIARAFQLGDKPELTFHGRKYLLTVSRGALPDQILLDVHEIAQSG